MTGLGEDVGVQATAARVGDQMSALVSGFGEHCRQWEPCLSRPIARRWRGVCVRPRCDGPGCPFRVGAVVDQEADVYRRERHEFGVRERRPVPSSSGVANADQDLLVWRLSGAASDTRGFRALECMQTHTIVVPSRGRLHGLNLSVAAAPLGRCFRPRRSRLPRTRRAVNPLHD